MPYFNYNGKLFTQGTAVISVANRGLRYGDGLFETFKLKDNHLILSAEHFARLWKGLQLLQFDMPKHFTPEKLEEQIVYLAQKNNHEKAARIRLMIVRGDGGLYDAINHLPNYSIESWPLAEDNETLNSNGLVACIYEDANKSIDTFSNCKHNNYLPYTQAALFAKKQKCNDAIVLNTNGNICDSTIANIFLVNEDVVYTPALTEGCVAGVMRQHIIQHLKSIGINCIQQKISVQQLMEANEVFLTNSIYKIRWVKQINHTTYTNRFTQKIYASLQQTIL
jgi:branched-chain amino acid aminotransferase